MIQVDMSELSIIQGPSFSPKASSHLIFRKVHLWLAGKCQSCRSRCQSLLGIMLLLKDAHAFPPGLGTLRSPGLVL